MCYSLQKGNWPHFFPVPIRTSDETAWLCCSKNNSFAVFTNALNALAVCFHFFSPNRWRVCLPIPHPKHQREAGFPFSHGLLLFSHPARHSVIWHNFLRTYYVQGSLVLSLDYQSVVHHKTYTKRLCHNPSRLHSWEWLCPVSLVPGCPCPARW